MLSRCGGRGRCLRAVFHVVRITTAAAAFVSGRGMTLHAVLFHLTRITTAAAFFVSGRSVILRPVLLLHLTRFATAATATVFVSSRGMVLHPVLFHHLTRIATATGGGAATRVFVVTGGLVRVLRKRSAGNGDG